MTPVTPETYADVFMQLQQRKVDYVVLGSVAAALHGFVARPISDLDIAVKPVPHNAQAAMAALASTGFVPTLPLPIMLVSVMRLFDVNHREVDLFIRAHVPFDELWRDARTFRVSGVEVPVASLAHMIRTKKTNGTPEDLEGARRLEAFAQGLQT